MEEGSYLGQRPRRDKTQAHTQLLYTQVSFPFNHYIGVIFSFTYKHGHCKDIFNLYNLEPPLQNCLWWRPQENQAELRVAIQKNHYYFNIRCRVKWMRLTSINITGFHSSSTQQCTKNEKRSCLLYIHIRMSLYIRQQFNVGSAPCVAVQGPEFGLLKMWHLCCCCCLGLFSLV